MAALVTVALAGCAADDSPRRLSSLTSTVETQAEFYTCRHISELETLVDYIEARSSGPSGVPEGLDAIYLYDLVKRVNQDVLADEILFYSIGNEDMTGRTTDLGLGVIDLESGLFLDDVGKIKAGTDRIRTAAEGIKERTLQGCILIDAG